MPRSVQIRKIYLYPVAGGQPVLRFRYRGGRGAHGWSADGHSLYVFRFGEIPAKVFELEMATGKRKLWKELVPADSAGIDTIRGITITPDAKAYVYGYIRTLSDLYRRRRPEVAALRHSEHARGQ